MSENNPAFHVEQSDVNDVSRGTNAHNLTSCPICKSRGFGHVLTATDYTVTLESFHILRCDRCEFTFTNPQPPATELDKYYASDAYISHSETKQGLINRVYHIAQRRNLHNKYILCNRLAPPGAWADYGSGAGAFVHYSATRGQDITGFEPSETGRTQALKKSINCLPIDAFPNDKKYACITMWHVLEHIPDFIQVLKNLSDQLLPNGILVIAVPNHESHDAAIYRSKWAAYDVPRHLWHFTEKDIHALSKMLHMTLEKIQPMKMDAYYVSMLSEKNLNNGLLFRGVWNGFLSNLRARLSGRPYSSQIYILRK
jgi:2-polyprenyl-3-methyl-5-hydroxy-6-metoxy-1,4-benzoquinol methylase